MRPARAGGLRGGRDGGMVCELAVASQSGITYCAYQVVLSASRMTTRWRGGISAPAAACTARTQVHALCAVCG